MYLSFLYMNYSKRVGYKYSLKGYAIKKKKENLKISLETVIHFYNKVFIFF